MTLDHMQARDPNAMCENCPWFTPSDTLNGWGDCHINNHFKNRRQKDFCASHPLNKIAYEKFIMDWRDEQHEAQRLQWVIEEQERHGTATTSEGTTA